MALPLAPRAPLLERGAPAAEDRARLRPGRVLPEALAERAARGAEEDLEELRIANW